MNPGELDGEPGKGAHQDGVGLARPGPAARQQVGEQLRVVVGAEPADRLALALRDQRSG